VRVRLALLLFVVVLAGIVGAAYAYVQSQQVDGPLTGESVSRSIAAQRPIAVMLDNISPDARPQSGLDRASLVFETLAEGGITRFMAVYLEHEAPVVGPVRSSRLYYNSWAAGLGVIFGHDGGNVDALQELKTLNTIFNVDADRVSGPFYRVSTRLSPHNEYTSTERLRQYAQTHGDGSGSSRMTIPHKDDASFSQRPARFRLSVQFSSTDYNVVWDYDRQSNSYLRSMGGVPHVDAITGQRLTAKNVVVMITDESPGYDPFTTGAIKLRTEGTGQATIYEDGRVITGTWSKPGVEDPLRLLDASGNSIALNRGATWVEVVPKGSNVTSTGG
jgi:Protein of unknown function (DUF3048) N-terminal domain/Protein of unknown function (DUF3048) C-terminal domain